jgi:transcriptional regulator GlxA family with amidase domain
MVYDLHKIFLTATRRLEITPSISSTQLARNLGIGRQTMAKAIKNATGLTFSEFRRNVLLRRTADLLKDDANLTIKEVAFALGYRSQGSLSRFIRRTIGHSAKELKLEVKEIAS